MKRKMFKGIFHNNRGFSLIELLVVITIMGILAGVAIPRFINVLDQAKDRAHDSNIHTIKSAAQVFFFETGDWPEEGFLNDTYEGDFKNYLDSFPADPFKRPNHYYKIEPDGDVEVLEYVPDEPDDPGEPGE